MNAMSAWVWVAATAVGLVGSVVARRRMRRKAVAGERCVRVMVLGRSEVGKTLLLGSMFREIGYHGAGVVVETDRDTTGRLLELTRRIEQADQELPDANLRGDTSSYEFDLVVRADGGERVRACRLSYLDYAGEHIDPIVRPGAAAPDTVVFAAVEEADVLMLLVDGARVRRLMDGSPDTEFFTDLGDMILLLVRAPHKVAHLVVTKWDLLDDDYRVVDVVARLDRFEPFRRIRHQQRHGVVRVIPVSAFGRNGYLVADGDGRIRRNTAGDRHWQPFNVAAPLAYALTDLLDGDARRAQEARASKRRQAVADYSAFFVAVGALLRLVSITVPLSSFGTAGFTVVNGVVEELTRLVTAPERSAKKRRSRPEQRVVLGLVRYFNQFPKIESVRLTPARGGPR